VKPGALQTVARGLQIHYLEEAVTVDPDKRPVALARLVAQRPDADAINR
jgi:hypothetical protein